MPLVLDGTNGVSGVDGTASNPAIEGTDSNTGIFYPAADTVAIGTGGTEALRVNSSQNVGIGTSSPVYRLDVLQAGATTISSTFAMARITGANATANDLTLIGPNTSQVRINFGDTDAANIGEVGYNHANNSMRFVTNGSVQATIDSSGNVGIGTSSPVHKLNVAGDIFIQPTTLTTASLLRVNNTGGTLFIGRDNSTGSNFGAAYASVFWSQGAYPIQFATNDVERARITSDGLLLIGSAGSNGGIFLNKSTTTFAAGSPFQFLFPAGNVFLHQPSVINQNNWFGLSSSNCYGATTGSANLLLSAGNRDAGEPAGNYIGSEVTSAISSVLTFGRINGGASIGVNGTKFEYGRFTSDGEFLIGTTTGGSKLTVIDSANRTEATAQFRIGGSGYAMYQWLDATAAYIGQNSPIRSFRIYSSASTAGVNLAAGGTSWGTYSDERLKYDIEPIVDGLTKLANVRCVSYRLKDVDAEDSQKKLGVIAQDLVGVVDEVIDITKRSNEDTEYMSVRYTELIPVLVKAIQEQQAMIDEMKAEIAALKAQP